MVNYSQSKIYTIRNREDTSLIYVGSTTQPLYKRFGKHKADCKNLVNMLLYKKVNDDWTNWFIELYENYSCDNREQLLKREGEVIRLIGTLNSRIEGRTGKEYYNDNIETIKEYHKKNYSENAEKIREQQRCYYNENQDAINKRAREQYIQNSVKKKEYYNENIDIVLEQRKQHYKANREKIRDYQKQYYQRKKMEKQQQE